LVKLLEVFRITKTSLLLQNFKGSKGYGGGWFVMLVVRILGKRGGLERRGEVERIWRRWWKGMHPTWVGWNKPAGGPVC
jgi:hypothetical protein